MTLPFDIDRLLASLTLEEKAALTSGLDFWQTKPVSRPDDGVEVPSIWVSDGPHGLRKQAQAEAFAESTPATCFPTAAALGSSWDPDLLRRVGEALGRETGAQKVHVLLGPGVNIKRTPLCGRNFEYVSEDPHLAGELGAAIVEGIQAQGVGTSLKHFAANNQETARMTVSSDVDERTLREIYLPAFETVVKRAQPWTVMCAYNKLNGTYASEHHWLLTEVLRDEWGFEGLVVSDWGAVHDRVTALAAGLDLQMPSGGTRPDDEVVAAVRDGRLDEAVLDQAARRVLRLVAQGIEGARSTDEHRVDDAAHHALAREAAAAGTVLLKNDEVDGRPLLPMDPAAGDVLLVGEFARTPRYQGAGSSQVNPTRLDDALGALRAVLGDVPFEPGFTIAGGPEGDDDALLAAAVAAARDAGTVVAFLGLPGPDESEGYDRKHLDLPDSQVALVRAVAAVNPRVVVVLANGSAVTVSAWHDLVPAVVETWLGGQAGGSAIADVLTGAVAPSGRLTETIPHRLVDTPAFGSFPGEAGHSRYGEGVLVGYRWYDTREVDVAYPFGHGLTYTSFDWSDLAVAVEGAGDSARVSVALTVTNVGPRAGAEVVQVYVRDPESTLVRPVRELRAFAKVALEPDESHRVELTLDARALSFWHPALGRWVVEGGEFVVEAASSSRDLRLSATVHVDSEPIVLPLTRWSTIHEWVSHPTGHPILRDAFAAAGAPALDGPELAWAADVPLKVLSDWNGTPLTADDLDALLAAVAATE
ncbi:glycoside hydrolase family 3 C-terminal domain-containing protein [Cellulomonas composti]|uniref:Exo-alpha-(1->6)-L-arabinopyranosidase n=1 Tax=Cellulomonas composti TaxID=266130 RepID=A0A511JBG0_9CELL|nr:glycoside hydrolase family 3 C-terminal domain-containing protein [Cellulomonas composti]GEL95332.1 glycosyl hydrolase [Cellulomonas composti]